MRKSIFAIAAALVLAPAAAQAQSALRVQPLSVDVVSPAQTSAITLHNPGRANISLQIRVFEWTQVNGEERLTPTTDVVASPPAATLTPAATFTIRVARTAGAVASGEKSYRLWVDELPPASAPRSGGGEVGVRLRYDLPLFFRAPGVATDLGWKASLSGGKLRLEATNSGARHARIEGLKVEGLAAPVSFGRGLLGYVLPGATRSWVSADPVAAAAPGAMVTVVAMVGGTEQRQSVRLGSN
jgi:fimbrial chaperone protein